MRYQDPNSVFQTSSSPGCPPGSFPVTPDLIYGFQATAPERGDLTYREHEYSRGTDLSRAESAAIRNCPSQLQCAHLSR